MHRCMFAAVAAAVLVPCGVMAQPATWGDVTSPGPGPRISPFVGFLPSLTREETWTFVEGDQGVIVQTDVVLAGGTAVGLVLDFPVARRFGVSVAGGFASRGDTDFFVYQTDELYGVDGHRAFFGRAGVLVHLLEPQTELMLRRVEASFFAGGVVLREQPHDRLRSGDALQAGTHFGANFGINAELPLWGERTAVQLGIEDNVIFWNETTLSALPYAYFGQPGTSRSSTRASTNASHMWLLRAGLRFRL